MAAVGDLRLGMISMPAGTPTFNNHTLDATNDAVGWGLQAREATAITHIGFRYGARTGTPPTYVATLEGISATTGAPDGTDVGGGSATAKTFTPPADATWDGTWQWVQLTNAYTPTRGQLLAPTIRYSSGTVDGSNNSTITSHLTQLSLSGSFFQYPSAQRLTAGTWAKQGNAPCIALRTASTRYGFPIKAGYATASASTAGLRQALKFTLPSAFCDTFTVKGVRISALLAGGSAKNPILGLWSASSALQTVTLDTEWSAFPNSNYVTYDWYFDEVTLSALTAGTAYYAGLEVADAASAGVCVNGLQLDNAADLDAYPGGSNFHFATYNGSVWSDDQTVRPFVELILDDVTEPAGGGGGIIRPVSLMGGLV